MLNQNDVVNDLALHIVVEIKEFYIFQEFYQFLGLRFIILLKHCSRMRYSIIYDFSKR